MSNVISITRTDPYVTADDWSADARGGEEAIAIVDRIRAGEDPDVVWMDRLDYVFAELNKDKDQGGMFLNAFILGILEEIAA